MAGFRIGLGVAAGLLLHCQTARAEGQDPAKMEFFEKEVRPLLLAKCVSCHGEKKQKGGLNMASREALLEGGSAGPAAVPGKPAESLLVQAVLYKSSPRMPPDKKLDPHEVEVLSRWVGDGMPWPTPGRTGDKPAAGPAPTFRISEAQRNFWSFRPVTDPAPPAVKNQAAAPTPIDRFIVAKLEEKGFEPLPAADARTLIRRATFDLIGLPPTPEEVDAFVEEHRAKPQAAWSALIERLLSSPHYGERWGRHWLDAAHYADTAGETADFPVPEAFRYRNYVIDSFNADKPYDRFLKEQIAGDLLAASAPPEKYAECVTATGFIAIARRFGFDPQNYQHLTIDDTLDTMGKAVLGLTLSCARCHDHKFDPVSTADYYGLYGIFSSTRYPFPGSEEVKRPRDFVPLLPKAEYEAKMAPFRAELARREADLKRAEAERDAAGKDAKALGEMRFPTPAAVAVQARLAGATAGAAAAKKALETFAAKPPPVELAYAVTEGTPANARIQKRGEPTNPGPEVPRGWLQILGGQSLPATAAGSGRLQLADWLTDPKNPLTARVMVNRIWLHHFGEGLVRTPGNFGKQGKPPTHPELLDHLATRFVESGWSIKAMHRMIMSSAVYQRASASGGRELRDSGAEALAALQSRDPENLWLGRFPRRRLEAEAIRDSILAASGGLDRTMAGAHPFPPASTWNFTQHNPFAAWYDTNRRSVYLMVPRLRRHPYLALFDGADPNSSTAQRSDSTVPTQALYFLNDAFVHREAARFAERIIAAASDDRARIGFAFRTAFGRSPTDGEIRAVEAFLERYRAQMGSGSFSDPAVLVRIWGGLARIFFAGNEFCYVD